VPWKLSSKPRTSQFTIDFRAIVMAFKFALSSLTSATIFFFHYNNKGLFCDPHIIANNKKRSFRKPAFANHNSSQTVKPLRYYNIRTRTITSPSQLSNLIQSQTFYDCNCFYIPFAIDITSETICNKPIAATTWRIDSKVYRFPK
jgi:hypothetical protein